MSTTAVLLGATGLVGSSILTTLLTNPSISHLTTISRRVPPSSPSPKLTTYILPNHSWESALTTIPAPSIYFSALATTSKQAGGFEAQKAIDYDLNLSLATAAKARGVKVYVLISSTLTNTNSPFPFLKMKGELEAKITELGFERTVFLRPGLIVGTREDSRAVEYGLRVLAGWCPGMVRDLWAQDAEVIARAAVGEGLRAWREVEGGCDEGRKVVVLGQMDIVRVGRTEWVEEGS